MTTTYKEPTPAERSAALMAARQLISDLAFDKRSLDELRVEAKRIWQHFPFPYELHHAAVNCPVLFDAKTIIPSAYEEPYDDIT